MRILCGSVLTAYVEKYVEKRVALYTNRYNEGTFSFLPQNEASTVHSCLHPETAGKGLSGPGRAFH